MSILSTPGIIKGIEYPPQMKRKLPNPGPSMKPVKMADSMAPGTLARYPGNQLVARLTADIHPDTMQAPRMNLRTKQPVKNTAGLVT